MFFKKERAHSIRYDAAILIAVAEDGFTLDIQAINSCPLTRDPQKQATYKFIKHLLNVINEELEKLKELEAQNQC